MLAGALTFALVFVVYLITNHPWVAAADSGEFQTMAKTGGIAHAGYPTFVLALEAIGRIPWSTFAFRANLLCSLCGAGAAALAAFHGARLSGRWWGGAAAGIALAFGYQLWLSSTVAEIYAFTLFLAALGFHLAIRFAQRPMAPVALGLGVLAGLGLGSHLLILALAPAVLVAIVRAVRAGRLRPGTIAALVAGFVLGLAPLGYQLAQDRPGRPMNYLALRQVPGEPVAAPSLGARVARLTELQTGRQYLDSTSQVRGARATLVRFRYALLDFVLNDFFLLGLPLAALGAWLLARRRDLDGAMLAIWFAASVFLVWYAAVSWDMAANYFVYGSWILAVCMSVGLAWIAGRRRRLGGALALALVLAPFARLAVPSPFGSAGWPALAWSRMPAEWDPFREDRSWDVYARGVLAAVPPHAVVLSNWHEAMPLEYARHALGLRPDVDLVLTEVPAELERNAAAVRTLGRPCYTTMALAPQAAVRLADAGPWRRGKLWAVVPQPPGG
jgi:hypothetical protein